MAHPLVQLVRLGERLDDRASGPWVHRLFTPGANVALLDALLRVFLQIRDRSGHLIQFIPNAAQQLYARQRTRRNIILKARQVGMTTYIAGRFFLGTILRPGTVTLQVAHTLESAQQIFRIVHRLWRHLDPDLERVIVTTRSNVRELAFAPTDSRYIVDTAGNENVGRGLTVHNLHASEVAFWPGEPRDTMAGLLAAVAPAGNVDVESTPHGLGGYFHAEWQRAHEPDASEDRFTPHFFPWWIETSYQLLLAPGETLGPLSTEERLLIERHSLKPEQIKFRRYLRATFGELAPQEFAENDQECFLVSGRPVFDVAAIEARLPHLPLPLRVSQNGAEILWLEPQPGREYIIGADVAEGGEHGDFSAAAVVDAETGLQCAELLARWPLQHFARELASLGRRYNRALIAVERNNQGHAVLFALQHQFDYAPLYQHRVSASSSSKAGWPMNAQTKPMAIQKLAEMLRDAPEVFSSRRLLEQCRSFVHHEDGEMGALVGTHDDLVIAIAIALAVRAQAGRLKLASVEF